MKRLVVISDLHCGHVVGLTPPEWQDQPLLSCGHRRRRGRARFHTVRKQMWKQYVGWMEELQPIDVLVVNGDAVDGKGEKSGGTELITSDRKEQADMSAGCISQANADAIVMTYGTGYHTGNLEDWEDIVADHEKVKAVKIGGHEWIDLHGVVFDFKHKVGASGIPHGRSTAVARERLWNLIWAKEREQAPLADILIRSHVHYHNGAFGPGWLAMTTPALQGMGSKYGARACSGVVDFGLVVFDVEESGVYQWSVRLTKIQVQRARALKL